MLQIATIVALTAVVVYYYAKYRLAQPLRACFYALLAIFTISIASLVIHAPKEVEKYVLYGGIIGTTIVGWDTLGRLPRRKRD